MRDDFTCTVTTHKGDLKTSFLYDGLAPLRIRQGRTTCCNNGGGIERPSGIEPDEPEPPPDAEGCTNWSWTLSSETRYIYDGNRVIQERDTNNTPTVSYTRGNDLS